jgi:anti-sigma regulatory factor (Ser/Thr protein kinase)
MDIPLDAPNLASSVAAERAHLRLPSLPHWIEPAAEYLRNKALLSGACLDAQSMKLTLALLEALSNSVVHGNLEISSDLKDQDDNAFAEMLAARSLDPRYASRCVDVVVDYDGERCQWALTDEGPGFDVTGVMARQADDPETLLCTSGRGILMMRAFLDEVRYEKGGRRAILTLRKPVGDEKRRHTRRPVQTRLRVAPLRPDGSVDWESAYEAVSRNCSPEGIAFLQERLAVTDRIIIGIDSEGQPLYLPAEVRHWRNLGGDIVEIGCHFPTGTARPQAAMLPADARAAEEAIGALIERFQGRHLPHDDRRGHPRVMYSEQIEVQAHADAAPVAGFARDLSRGGIALITTGPLPLGTCLLDLPQGKGRTSLKVHGQVLRCNKIMEGFYDVGARFLPIGEG